MPAQELRVCKELQQFETPCSIKVPEPLGLLKGEP
jgi:hypothetical protein